MVSATLQPLYPQERDPLPRLQEAGWAFEYFLNYGQNLSPSGVRTRTVTPLPIHCTIYVNPAAISMRLVLKCNVSLKISGAMWNDHVLIVILIIMGYSKHNSELLCAVQCGKFLY